MCHKLEKRATFRIVYSQLSKMHKQTSAIWLVLKWILFIYILLSPRKLKLTGKLIFIPTTDMVMLQTRYDVVFKNCFLKYHVNDQQ
jgi:hypothetical protein